MCERESESVCVHEREGAKRERASEEGFEGLRTEGTPIHVTGNLQTYVERERERAGAQKEMVAGEREPTENLESCHNTCLQVAGRKGAHQTPQATHRRV